MQVYHMGYQTWAFDTTNLSKLFVIMILSVFGQQGQGQRGGQQGQIKLKVVASISCGVSKLSFW